MLEPCWRHFSPLGASWAHFALLAAFVVALAWFLCVLGRSGLDFGGVRDASGSILEAPGLHFSRFLGAFACSGAGMAWMLRPLQNTGRSGTKRTSEHAGHPARDAENEQESARQLLKQAIRPRACANQELERSKKDFGEVSAPPECLLAGSWALLGGSWALLGRFGVFLGVVFGCLSGQLRKSTNIAKTL